MGHKDQGEPKVPLQGPKQAQHLGLHLRLDGEDWRVEQVRVDDSVVAVTAPGPAWRLAWAETEVGPLPLRP